MQQVIETLKANGLHAEADAVAEMAKQRAELLEALKHLRHNARASGAEMGLALDVADEAIYNAEK